MNNLLIAILMAIVAMFMGHEMLTIDTALHLPNIQVFCFMGVVITTAASALFLYAYKVDRECN